VYISFLLLSFSFNIPCPPFKRKKLKNGKRLVALYSRSTIIVIPWIKSINPKYFYRTWGVVEKAMELSVV
jgi:hypothetical protein